MKVLAAFVCLFACTTTAVAMVGGATAAAPATARHLVLIVGSRGNFCTGTAIAADLVLTAAHCVLPGAEYKLVEYDANHRPRLADVREVTRHPQFSLQTLLAHRATADVALLKLAVPLKPPFAAAPLAAERPVTVGDRFVVAGFGVAVRGDGKTGGTARAADLVATGQPGTLQLRLVDPAGKGERAGLGACTGDSGAPAFDMERGIPMVAGVVSWSTGPRLTAGCGGLTGITPLARYRGWIIETARKLGSALPVATAPKSAVPESTAPK
ncbi:MAG TPA: trypsin-like serine protease [Xanthobacteraceae bacterium]|nr:trypsin-like serine protease [Xanthobacteraceae bacterium]